MNYFKYFPTLSMADGVDTKIFSDISIRYRIKQTLTNSPTATYIYRWKDGDRPDIVAENYYGDSGYAWLVLMSGELYDWVYDLPMNDYVFEKWLTAEYGISLEDSKTTIHHYEDGDGTVIDQTTYSEIPVPKRTVYVYDYESEQNDKRRFITLLSREYLNQIQEELEDKMKAIKAARETVLEG